MVNKRFSNNTVKIEHIKMVHSEMSFTETSINFISFSSYKEISDDSPTESVAATIGRTIMSASAAVYLFLKEGS